MAERLVVIRTLEQLQELKDYLTDKEFIAADTETDGVEKSSRVVGFSVSAEIDVGYYVILSYWDVVTQSMVHLETKDHAAEFFRGLIGKSLVWHNAGFDCSMIYNNFGVELMPSTHTDTLLLAHLVDENRLVGLKELGVSIFGEDANKEQKEMKESVTKNGGMLTQDCYELYKADAELLARYGAKDAILTLKLFYDQVEKLYAQSLDKFFYEDETMPLLRGPTYDLNNTGLKVDQEKLLRLKGTLEAECLEAKAFIHNEIEKHVREKYPGTNKSNHFNIGAPEQLSWLLFSKLGNEFVTLTDGGKAICKALDMKVPYAPGAKRHFIQVLEDNFGRVYEEAKFNTKTGKMGRPKKIGNPWKYMQVGEQTFAKYVSRYKWVERLVAYKKNLKLLNTYVEGIQSRMRYGIIRPDFLQHGTTSGRFSCRNPNFTNLPRDDKRVKTCVISRPGKVFVGSDFSQVEPRVFASLSGDERLQKCFSDGDDFYSVIGASVFGKYDCTLKKDDSPNSFPVKYKSLRSIAKVIALATPYGTTAPQMARTTGKSIEECQDIIDDYFRAYPNVEKMMYACHEEAKKYGRVLSLFGRPRRMPDAMMIPKIYGKTSHGDLPYNIRNILNLAMNHTVQSTAASIANRAMIKLHGDLKLACIDAKIVLFVHDEIVVECDEKDAEDVLVLLQNAMEQAAQLPGVPLAAEPKIANNLADLK